MSTLFFHDEKVTSATAGTSKYGHTFGGSIAHDGAARQRCLDRQLHLLHRINLDDPLMGAAIPGVQWLPLYYCFDFRVNELGYRLSSDDDIEVFFWPDEPNVSAVEGFPDDDYPMEFPRCSIQLDWSPYDPTDRKEAYSLGAVFGIDKLSQDDRRWVLEQEAEQFEMANGYRPDTEEELLEALSFPFAQARPNSACPNPACSNHSTHGNLSVLALMPAEPVPDVQTFGSWGGGVQLIFELCPECHTVHVSNQCT